MYDVSKALNGPEYRYPNIEKLAYALVVSTRKLRAYFESHPIIVYTNAPLRQIYHKLDQSGRMLKWSIELCGYDITFAPRTAIKAQALADFLVEATFSDQSAETAIIPYTPPERSESWTLMVDGAVNQYGAGIGLVLISPISRTREERSITLGFTVTNNQAEYEAVILGMQWALQAGVSRLTVLSDSQVVVHQLRGEYAIYSDKLKEYAMLARNIKTRFASFAIRKVPRLENEQADILSKIASGEVQNTHHIQVEVLHNPSTHVSETIHVITDEAKSWIDDIKDFIEQGILPEAPDQAKSVRRQSARYLIHDGLLYR